MCCLSLIEVTEKLKQQSGNFRGGWGHLNGFSARWEGNLNKNFPKFKCPGVCPGGMLKLRFDWYITCMKCCMRLAVKPLPGVHFIVASAENSARKKKRGERKLPLTELFFFVFFARCFCAEPRLTERLEEASLAESSRAGALTQF